MFSPIWKGQWKGIQERTSIFLYHCLKKCPFYGGPFNAILNINYQINLKSTQYCDNIQKSRLGLRKSLLPFFFKLFLRIIFENKMFLLPKLSVFHIFLEEQKEFEN